MHHFFLQNLKQNFLYALMVMTLTSDDINRGSIDSALDYNSKENYTNSLLMFEAIINHAQYNEEQFYRSVQRSTNISHGRNISLTELNRLLSYELIIFYIYLLHIFRSCYKYCEFKLLRYFCLSQIAYTKHQAYRVLKQ